MLLLTGLPAEKSYADAGSVEGFKENPVVETGALSALPGTPVYPTEFKGSLRNLPYYPYGGSAAQRPYRPLRRGPVQTKYAAPEAVYVRDYTAPVQPGAPMPAPVRTFQGMSRNSDCNGVSCGSGWPSDVNGDVGPDHYVQAVNASYAIYNKTGVLQTWFTEDQLWQGSGAPPCDGNSAGDPVVVYDPIGDRWILTHFAFPVDGSGNPVSPFYQCIAVSQTSDPVTSGWWLYSIRMDSGASGFPPVGTLNDYPKFGIWPDCLYMSANEFDMTTSGGKFNGTFAAAFSRADLEAGRPLTWTGLFLSYPAYNIFGMLPSNLLGSSPSSLPPAGTPNYFVSESQPDWGFEVRKFVTSNNCGTGLFYADAPPVVVTPEYNFNFGDFIPQPGTTVLLDGMSSRLLQKAQYRRLGSAESLWIVQSVGDGPATDLPLTTVRPQWAQIDVTGETVSTTPVQLQAYLPDSTVHRWMGSLAADKFGNMALGYSASSGTVYPSVLYSGRLVSDPLSTLPQTEQTIATGAGSQTNNCGGGQCHRWGDYSAMSVDPSDDCTFWYTNQYYDSPTNGASGNWQTSIGAFRFPACDPNGLVKKVSDSQKFASISGALASLTSTDTLRLQSITFYEPVSISSFRVTLAGGYNPGSSFVTADGFSAVKSLSISGSGSAIVSALSLQ